MKYRTLGTIFNRIFRNDLNKNFEDIDADIKRLGAGAQQAVEAASEAETQAVYAADRGDYADEKGLYASNQGDYAKAQGNHAKTQGDYAKAVGDTAKTNWKGPVNNFAAIATTYPNPVLGDTVQTLDNGYVYRYDGLKWEFTQGYSATALANVNAQLAQNAKKLDYRQKQARYYAAFLNKLGLKTAFKIVAQGDSLTYGQDTYSPDKRAANSDPTMDSQSNSTVTQAGKTYPEAMQEHLRSIYGSSIATVVNRGVPGHYADASKNKWSTNPSADLHLIMLGTNDSTAGTPSDKKQKIDAYVNDMCLLIEQIIDFGSAVVLLTPPKISQGGAHPWLESYREALHSIGYIYGIPVINTDDFLDGHDMISVQADDPATGQSPDDLTHFNTKGYTIIGTKIAGLFVGTKNLLNPYKVTNDSILSVEGDGIGYVTDGAIGGDNASPLGVWSNKYGSRVNLAAGQKFTTTFYTDNENLLLIPIFTAGANSRAEVKVNFGSEQPYIESSFMINGADRFAVTQPPSVYTFALGSKLDLTAFNALVKGDIGTKVIHLTGKGFQTITVSNIGTADSLSFYGFIVYGYREFISERQKSKATVTTNVVVPAGAYITVEVSLPGITTASAISISPRWGVRGDVVYGAFCTNADKLTIWIKNFSASDYTADREWVVSYQ
ncbi:hypothetical protein A8F94_17450 [Bacillus sp. FJAT-27225]|uniref:SGNH/GDSL hydrolase family protein n=1 Tax=Bacillus sp. FJAT-27225 TaxID=1743144 RepID=UPI00080C24CC|nr:GDSL-type esterase/lipase family protein [Bacillus sp. FJAT-27225]OCA84482.1 hypothetical protein A8F94_17450 [Bacillus sp. FJAT-27225]